MLMLRLKFCKFFFSVCFFLSTADGTNFWTMSKNSFKPVKVNRIAKMEDDLTRVDIKFTLGETQQR